MICLTGNGQDRSACHGEGRKDLERSAMVEVWPFVLKSCKNEDRGLPKYKTSLGISIGPDMGINMRTNMGTNTGTNIGTTLETGLGTSLSGDWILKWL